MSRKTPKTSEMIASAALATLVGCEQVPERPQPDADRPDTISTTQPEAPPSQSVADQPPLDAANPENTRIARPVRVENSPGPGVPIRGTSPAQSGAFLLAGDWTFAASGDQQALSLRFIARPGASSGRVELLSPWTADFDPPSTWVYLVLGQLTLTDDQGNIVWSGEVVDDQTLSATGTNLLAFGDLIRK